MTIAEAPLDICSNDMDLFLDVATGRLEHQVFPAVDPNHASQSSGGLDTAANVPFT